MKSEKLLNNWQFMLNRPGWQKFEGETVTLPHDFMLATPRTPDSPTWADYGYFQPCKGTYVRKITRPEAETVLLRFDGVMGLCEVFVNGERAGFHPYGYTAFTVDIAKFLHDGENEIRVEVDATCQPASRWYTGAGIYREVELLTSGADRLEPWATSVRTLGIFGDSAQIEISTEIASSRRQIGKIEFSIPELGFSMVRSVQLETGKNSFSAKTMLKEVKLWSVYSPNVYTCTARLMTDVGDDSESVSFGVRTVACDPERGLLLNGEPIKLYGTCNHHDNGIVGSASFRSAEERRVRILKENGFNAIRTSHNPPSSMLLDVCDRLGMLVIDEIFDCWTNGKKQYDYHLWFDKYAPDDVAAMVLRDRNHPSVVMWSTGNEIFERAGRCDGYAVGKMIADIIKKNDPTRPLTHAFCEFWDNWEYSAEANKTLPLPPTEPDFWCEKIAPQAGNLDVLGYNYMNYRIAKDEQIFKSHLFAITESYPMDVLAVKRTMDKHPKLIGEFVWTGWDYFGETGLGRVIYDSPNGPSWGLDPHPNHISNCGDFSICGFKKPQSYYRDVAWGCSTVKILTVDPDNVGRQKSYSGWGFWDADRTWTYPGKDGKVSEVYVFTLADECELSLNGKSLGRKSPNEKGFAIFEVPYACGKLEATAYRDGKAVGNDALSTVGKAAAIKIVADTTGKTGAADLIFAEIDLVDENGEISWGASEEITVTAEGGKVLGTGSGKVDDEHDYTKNVCSALHGRLLAAILPESDRVTVTVAGGELKAEAEIVLK